MSELIEAQGQIQILARVLRVDPAELSTLERLPAKAIRALRERVTDLLFDAEDDVFKRLAHGSKFLPPAVTASVAQKAFGPLLCARVAGRLDPHRAVDVATRLDPDFLTEVAIDLDPRRAADVIAHMPLEHVLDVARDLLRRNEYVAMGLFVPQLSDEAIVAATKLIDDESLLHIAFVLDDKSRLDHVIGLMPPERLDRVVRTGAERGLVAQITNLTAHVRPELQARIERVLQTH